MKIRTVALVLVVALGGLAACGEDGKPAATPSTEVSVDPDTLSAPPPQAIPTQQPERISLTAGQAKVGDVEADVVRFKDRVVYRFEADEHRPSKVTCTGDCLIIWPPLLTDGTPVQLSGVDKKLVGTVQRADGLTQVTLDGWPLYLFKQDETAADTKGEGVGGNWSVIRPDGKPVVKK